MADAAWILDISATLDDGPETAAKLDEIAASLVGSGRKLDGFKDAIQALSVEMARAASVSEAANAALSEGADQYKVLEREAIRASKALERANGKNAVPLEVKQQADAANAALTKYERTLKALENDAKAAGDAQAKIGKQLKVVEGLGKRVEDRNVSAKKQYRNLAIAASQLPGPLAHIGVVGLHVARANEVLSESFGAGATSAYIAAAAVATLTALMIASAVAGAAMGYEFAKVAITQAETARNIQLTRDAIGELSHGGREAVAAFDDVQDATGLTEDQMIALTKRIRPLADAFHSGLISAAQVPMVLKAAAQAEAALGSGGADEFIQKIEDGRLSAKAFADQAERSFGPTVAAKMRGLDAQGALFQRHWRDLFAVLDIEPVLAAFGKLVGIFDRANPAAQGMGTIIETVFKLINDNAETAALAVERFVIGFQIGMFKILIALKPIGGPLAKLFSNGTDGTFAHAKEIGETVASAFTVIAVAAAILAAALLPIAVIVGLIVAVLAGVVIAIFAVGFAIGTLIRNIFDLGFTATTWLLDVGKNLMLGLVHGIESAGKWVVDAVKNTVSDAIDAAKDLLGIHSPSTVFADIGENTADGFTQGVDAGSGKAHGAITALVQPDAVSGSAGGGSAGSGGGGVSKHVDLGGATFNFYGVKDGEQAQQGLGDLLARILEDDAASLAGAQ